MKIKRILLRFLELSLSSTNFNKLDGVDIPQIPTTEEAVAEENLKSQSVLDSTKKLNDSHDPCLTGLGDFSLSFPDVDLTSNPNVADLGGNPVFLGSVKGELGVSEESFEVIGDGILEKDEVQRELGGNEGFSLNSGIGDEETGVVERSCEMGSDGFCEKINTEGVLDGDGPERKLEDLGSSIEEQLRKVILDGASNCVVPVVAFENYENTISDVSVVNGGFGPTSQTVMLDGSSSRIDSTNDEYDIEGVKVIGKKINGTGINVDESEGSSSSSPSSVSPSSSSDEEEDEDSGELSWKNKAKNEKGPITSKNEVKVLPPVPSVSVTLQTDHQTLPVGTVLWIHGAEVIVEGVEKHNPLNEGSMLWITESRLPLGIIDKTFGTVENPYYILRYNSGSEVPTGIQQGTSISFVQEFANHSLNNEKSGKNKPKLGTERNEKGKAYEKAGRWNHNRLQTSVSEDQHMGPPVATSSNQDGYSRSRGSGQVLSGDQAMAFPYQQQMAQAALFSHPNGIWFLYPYQESVGLPPGWPANGMPWMQQYHPYPLYQAPFETDAGFQQQMSTIPGGLPLNFDPLAGQLHFGFGPTFGSWPTSLNQNMSNSSLFGMGLQAQQAPLPGGSQMSHNLQPWPAFWPQGSQMSPYLPVQRALSPQGSEMSPNLPTQRALFPQGSQMNPNLLRRLALLPQGSQIIQNLQAWQDLSSQDSQLNHNLPLSPANLGENVDVNEGRGGSGRGEGHPRDHGHSSGGRGRCQGP